MRPVLPALRRIGIATAIVIVVSIAIPKVTELLRRL